MKHKWEYKQFAEIATSITPRIKVDKSEYKLEGSVPIISQEESFISGYWDNLDDITPHNGPVVIFGDHSRVLKYVECDFVVGADGVKIISPKDCISAKFLYHFLKWYNIPSLGYSRHFKLIKESSFPVPPMEVQERIVAELDKINEVIADCRELLRNLDALAQSLFYDTFGDPNSGVKFSKQYIGKLSINLDAKRKPVTKSERIAGIFPYYGASGIVDYVSDYIFDGEYLLISEDGANLITRSQPIAFISKEKVWVNNHAHVLDFQNSCSKIYVMYYMNTLDISEKITGAAQPKLTQKALNDIMISWPPLALQEKFAARIEQIEAQKKHVEATIAELLTLLASRMDYWFN